MLIKLLILGAALAPLCLAHPDPSQKATGKLVVGQGKYGDCNGCTLRASPSMLEGDENGEAWVTVQIDGVSFGQASDWVGAFAPADIDSEGALLRYPVRWQLASQTCIGRSDVPPTPAPAPVPHPSAASCAAQGCSEHYNASAPCSCTSQCHKYNECCDDYDAVCSASSLSCVGDACCSTNNYTAIDLQGGGTATLNFKLVNLHTDYVFALVQGNAQFPSVVAVSNAVSFKRAAEPTGVHLATTSKPGQMRVTWSAPATSATKWPGTVRWGTAAGSFDSGTANATASTYTRDQLCQEGGPAAKLGWRDPPTIFSAVMDGLKPGQRYFYTVGSSDPDGGWSHERRNFSFLAPRAPATSAAEAGSATILAFGDMGKAPSCWDGSLEHSWDNPPGLGELGSWNTSKQLLSEYTQKNKDAAVPDAVLHIGDISYAVGYATEWDEFLAQIEPIAAQTPWMTVDGNHERNCPCTVPPASALAAGINWLNGTDSGGECGVPYEARFPMPQPGFDKPWYALAEGPVAIVMMSTEHDFSTGSEQLKALDQLLGAVDRAATPWLIFAGHRPMYVDSKYPSPSEAPLQALVEPLLLKYKVDMALWGHHHSYHRSCPMKAKGECVAAGSADWGVVHAVIGAAGYSFSSVATGASAPAWVQFASDSVYGYSRMTANATHFHFGFVRSDNGELLDEVSLGK